MPKPSDLETSLQKILTSASQSSGKYLALVSHMDLQQTRKKNKSWENRTATFLVQWVFGTELKAVLVEGEVFCLGESTG